MSVVKNVLGTNLEPCCENPLTGFFRDGYCSTSPEDQGVHTVCALVTDEFLEYSKAQGNDLSTANLRYGFPGLKAGDTWCLCAARWKEALEDGMAPQVVLAATHQATLKIVSLEQLQAHAIMSKT
ncbi:MAG: DUF2237 domain-containing protein [Candidatus Obscuribacterales bacterium]|jgi:hypothetical protein